MSTTETKPDSGPSSPADMRFIVYGHCNQHITFAALAELQRTDGDLWAHAEDCGNEGCFCEIARWNHSAFRWECFAYKKFHGFDHPTRLNLNCDEAAEFVAAEINALGYMQRSSIVSRMPTWSGGAQ